VSLVLLECALVIFTIYGDLTHFLAKSHKTKCFITFLDLENIYPPSWISEKGPETMELQAIDGYFPIWKAHQTAHSHSLCRIWMTSAEIQQGDTQNIFESNYIISLVQYCLLEMLFECAFSIFCVLVNNMRNILELSIYASRALMGHQDHIPIVHVFGYE